MLATAMGRFEHAEVARFSECALALQALDSAETFVHDVLVALRALVGADAGLYGVTDLQARQTVTGYSFPTPTEDPAALARFDENFDDHPAHRGRLEVGGAIAISDVTSASGWHASGLYQEFFRPLGLDDSLLFRLPSDEREVHAIGVARKGFGFSENDKQLLKLMGPHVVVAWQRIVGVQHANKGSLVWHGRTLGEQRYASAKRQWRLSQRQCDVLLLLARGASNKEIAARLRLSTRTVELHVTELLRKSSSSNRAELVAAYWTAAVSDSR